MHTMAQYIERISVYVAGEHDLKKLAQVKQKAGLRGLSQLIKRLLWEWLEQPPK